MYEAFETGEGTYLNSWLPTNIRTFGGGPSIPDRMTIDINYVEWFYGIATISEKYIFTLYSMVVLVLGGNIGPVNDSQVSSDHSQNFDLHPKGNFVDHDFDVLLDHHWDYFRQHCGAHGAGQSIQPDLQRAT